MTVSELDEMPIGDDIVLQFEQFKMGLMARATGGDMDQVEYARVRKLPEFKS